MNSFQIGVAFLAYRGHPEWRHAFHRFAASYERHPSGIAHRLYIIFKGFEDPEHLHEGAQCFARLSYTPIPVADQGFGFVPTNWLLGGCARR